MVSATSYRSRSRVMRTGGRQILPLLRRERARGEAGSKGRFGRTDRKTASKGRGPPEAEVGVLLDKELPRAPAAAGLHAQVEAGFELALSRVLGPEQGSEAGPLALDAVAHVQRRLGRIAGAGCQA